MKSILFFILTVVGLNCARGQAVQDTTLLFYANFTDQISIDVSKEYVNAMTYKFGFGWKEMIIGRLVDLAKSAKAEYENHQKQYFYDNINAVTTVAELNTIKSKAKGYPRTVPKSSVDSLKTRGFIVATE